MTNWLRISHGQQLQNIYKNMSAILNEPMVQQKIAQHHLRSEPVKIVDFRQELNMIRTNILQIDEKIIQTVSQLETSKNTLLATCKRHDNITESDIQPFVPQPMGEKVDWVFPTQSEIDFEVPFGIETNLRHMGQDKRALLLNGRTLAELVHSLMSNIWTVLFYWCDNNSEQLTSVRTVVAEMETQTIAFNQNIDDLNILLRDFKQTILTIINE